MISHGPVVAFAGREIVQASFSGDWILTPVARISGLPVLLSFTVAPTAK